MKIVFWGTPGFCTPIFESIINSRHQIIGIVTQPDKRRGRGKSQSFSPIKQKAIDHNIIFFTPEEIRKDIVTRKSLEKLNADLFVVVAYGQILPKEIIDLPKNGCWNIHASLLPKWRGAAPIQWSLINGDNETGVGIMKMEEGLDTGDVLMEQSIKIDLLDNAHSINEKLSNLSSSLIVKALDCIEKISSEHKLIEQLSLTKQEDLGREKSYARMIRKEDYIINWDNSATEIHRKVAGLYPNAYTYIGKKRVKLTMTIPINDLFIDYLDNKLKVFITKEYPDVENGKIIANINEIGIIVKAFNSLLLIKGAKIEGKKELFANPLIQQLKTIGNNEEISFGNS